MFEWITKVVERLGYAGVGGLTFLENVFPPIPSEVVIPLAGFVAAQGGMGLAGVIAAGSLGSIAGAWFWYEVGRRMGEERLRRWVDRHGRWLTLSAKDVDRAQSWFRRHGNAAVFVGRLVPGVRTFVSLPAGFSGMPIAPFLIYSTLGTVLWTAGLACAGVLLQANFTRVSDYIDAATNALLVGLAGMLAYRYVTCWTGSREACAA
jgi:membrane protein DedA with SNARE-associated domain